MVATQRVWSSTIFVAPSGNPEKGNAISTVRSDGIGLDWMPDGRLVSQDVESKFWLQAPDGKNRTPLFQQKDASPGDFCVCGNGRYILFSRSEGWSGLTIWQIDMELRNLKQLTNGGNQMAADCSPDGTEMIYTSVTDDGYRLMKVPMPGGPAMPFFEERQGGAFGRYSPQGNRIAILQWEAKGDTSVPSVAILDSQRRGTSERPAAKFPMPTTGQIPDNTWTVLWKPDGTQVSYLFEQGSTTNVWTQPVSGGSPVQLTHFPDRVIAFAWSPDGKQLAYTRVSTPRDVVLFKFH